MDEHDHTICQCGYNFWDMLYDLLHGCGSYGGEVTCPECGTEYRWSFDEWWSASTGEDGWCYSIYD